MPSHMVHARCGVNVTGIVLTTKNQYTPEVGAGQIAGLEDWEIGRMEDGKPVSPPNLPSFQSFTCTPSQFRIN